MNAIHSLHARLTTLVPDSKRNKDVSFFFFLLGCAMDNFNVQGSYALYTSIQSHFNADSTTVTWTLSAYALTMGAFIMLAGKLTDFRGPRTVFLYGTFFTSIFAVICAAIENEIVVLIVFRALQGFAASCTIPPMFPMIVEYYAKRGKMAIAMALFMVTFTASSGFGLVIGGAFVFSSIGYKGLYYLTFALSFVTWLFLYIAMSPIPVHNANKNMRMRDLDWPGTVLFIVGVLLIILGLTEGGNSWKKPSAYVPIPIGFVVLVATFYFEIGYLHDKKTKIKKMDEDAAKAAEKGEEPVEVHHGWAANVITLFPREVFKVPNFITFVIATLCDYITFLCLGSIGLQYAEFVEGDSALIAALKVLPAAIGILLCAFTNREALVYKVGMKFVLISSQLALVGMLVWISRHDYHKKNNYWIYSFAPTFLGGYLTGVYFNIYLNAVMRNTPVHLQGTVGGLLQTVGEVGLCLGNAITATILGDLQFPKTPEEKAKINNRFSNVWYFSIAVQAFMVIVLLFIKDQKSLQQMTDTTVEPEPGKEAGDEAGAEAEPVDTAVDETEGNEEKSGDDPATA